MLAHPFPHVSRPALHENFSRAVHRAEEAARHPGQKNDHQHECAPPFQRARHCQLPASMTLSAIAYPLLVASSSSSLDSNCHHAPAPAQVVMSSAPTATRRMMRANARSSPFGSERRARHWATTGVSKPKGASAGASGWADAARRRRCSSEFRSAMIFFSMYARELRFQLLPGPERADFHQRRAPAGERTDFLHGFLLKILQVDDEALGWFEGRQQLRDQIARSELLVRRDLFRGGSQIIDHGRLFFAQVGTPQ